MANPLDQIPKEHLVNLKGKLHPTYPGVLAAAYANGLVGMRVEIKQCPLPENGNLAICIAEATFKGPDGEVRTFSEVGDCSDGNCTPHIAPHKTRMAATRAKGRALRDALGIGVALKEEIDGTDEAAEGDGQASRRGSNQGQRSAPGGARTARSNVDTPAGPVREEARGVVESATGKSCQHLGCGRELTRSEVASCAQAPMDGGYYCMNHAAQHVKENGTVRDSCNLECSNAGCGKALTKGQHDVSQRSYGQALCPPCQKQFTRIG